MSTRSSIGIKNEDGSVTAIYCHWGGYPDHHLPILKEHYNTKEKVESLLALGNLSSLEISTECPEGHTFENAVNGYCVAYGRDRGELNQEAQKYICEVDWKHSDGCLDYNYLFDNNEWVVLKN